MCKIDHKSKKKPVKSNASQTVFRKQFSYLRQSVPKRVSMQVQPLSSQGMVAIAQHESPERLQQGGAVHSVVFDNGFQQTHRILHCRSSAVSEEKGEKKFHLRFRIHTFRQRKELQKTSAEFRLFVGGANIFESIRPSYGHEGSLREEMARSGKVVLFKIERAGENERFT